MKKILSFAFALLSAAALPGCVATAVEGGVAAGGMYATKSDDLPPADTADQMAPHETWCYKTLGEETECYAEPQDTPPGRLLNVDPPNRYPLTARAYAQVLEQNRLANAPKEPPKDMLDQESTPPSIEPAIVTPAPLQVTPPVTPPQPAVKHKKHKKKHKKAKKTPPPSATAPVTPPLAAPSPPPVISN